MSKKRTLRVVNNTRQVTLIEHGRVADTFWTRLKGLMGVRRLALGDGLLITPANQIHTHFMATPVDVLYIDANHRLIDVDEELSPWRIGRMRRGARYVIEAPCGLVAFSGSAAGDRFTISTNVG